MATKSAGRVSIRVLPDSSRFREDLKKSLERIEKTMKAEIPAHLVLTRESIRKLKEQLRDLEVRIKVEPFIRQEDLHNLKKKIEDIDPDVHVGLNTLNARRQLATLTRTRQVSIFVRVNKASLAAAATALSAITGTRLVGNIFKDFFEGMKNLDKNAPKIGLIANGIVTLVGALGAGVSNAAALAGSLVALGQSAVLLPALFTAAGISIGVLVAVFKDMKTVLKDLGPSFTSLQDAMSAEFWAIAANPIRDLVHTLMPSLREQLINTSQAFGVMTRELATNLKKSLTADVLNRSFDNMNQAIARASNAVAPLVRAFVTLGTFGTQYLPRLAAWLVTLANRFDAFVARAAKSGDLEKWAERGIQEFKDLGRVIKETFRVFGALVDAANAAGGSGFAELADGLKKLADMMQTSNFQTGLTTILAGAHKAMDGLIEGIGNLGPGLQTLAPTLAAIFATVGQTLARLGDALSDLFADPVLNQGLKDFFSGFLSFIDQLRPAMGPLGTIIGTLATALGSLLAQVAPLISQGLQLLAPIFVEVWKAVQPLIPPILQLVEELLPPFAEILMTIATDVLPELVPILADLAPVLVAVVKAAAPVLVEFFKALGKALEAAQPFIEGASTWLTDIATALNQFPLALFQWFATNKLDFFKTMFGIAIDHPEIPAFFSALNLGLGGLFDKFKGAGDSVKTMGEIATKISELASPETGIPALGTAITVFTGILPNWQVFWAGMQTAIAAFSTSSTLVLSVALEQLKAKFPIFFSGVQTPWTGFWQGLAPVVTTYLGIVRGGVTAGLGAVGAQFGLFIAQNLPKFPVFFTLVQTAFRVGMSGISIAVATGIPGILRNFISMNAQNLAEVTRGFNALVGIAGVLLGRFAAAVGIGVARAVQVVTGMPSQMTLALFNAVGEFFSAGASLITAFVQGISSGVNPAVSAAIAVISAVKAVLPHSPAEKGPLSGQGWINLKKSGTAITKQFASGLYSDLSVVQNATGRVVSAVRFNHAGVSSASVRSAAGGVAGADARALVNIEGDYYGATPEAVANDFDKKLRRNALASQVGKIGIG